MLLYQFVLGFAIWWDIRIIFLEGPDNRTESPSCREHCWSPEGCSGLHPEESGQQLCPGRCRLWQSPAHSSCQVPDSLFSEFFVSFFSWICGWGYPVLSLGTYLPVSGITQIWKMRITGKIEIFPEGLKHLLFIFSCFNACFIVF